LEIPSAPSNPILQTKESALVIDKLQTGQFLQAKIVDQLNNRSDVIIRLGNQLLKVKSDIPVTIGQTIKVLVEKTSSEVILKVKSPPQQNNLINSSLRQLLPKQTPVNDFQRPLSQLFASIDKQAIKSAIAQSKELAPQLIQIKRLAISILQALPDQKSITTRGGIKDAIQNSGVFLEPKLQQTLLENKAALKTNTGNSKVSQKLPIEQLPTTKTVSQHPSDPSRVDIKASLIKLITLLNAWPKIAPTQPQQTTEKPKKTQQTILNPTLASLKPTVATLQSAANKMPIPPLQLLDQQIKELINKTEGAISKITLNQLASSNIDNSTSRQTWQIEIPFLNQHATESIFLKIEKEAPHNQPNEMDPQWIVSLEMNPPKLGLIKNKLTLSNHRISSSFWAEESETRNLINQHLSSFKEQLSRANLKTDSIQLQKGAGPVIQNVKLADSILNEKA